MLFMALGGKKKKNGFQSQWFLVVGHFPAGILSTLQKGG